MSPLFHLLLRIVRGERFEKASPAETRWQVAGFGSVAVFIVSFVFCGDGILRRASAPGICLYAIACGILCYFVLMVWVRFIPLKISILATILAWLCAFYAITQVELVAFTH